MQISKRFKINNINKMNFKDFLWHSDPVQLLAIHFSHTYLVLTFIITKNKQLLLLLTILLFHNQTMITWTKNFRRYNGQCRDYTTGTSLRNPNAVSVWNESSTFFLPKPNVSRICDFGSKLLMSKTNIRSMVWMGQNFQARQIQQFYCPYPVQYKN